MSVEDKIKELLEASIAEAAPKGAEDLGPAVTDPETKSGPDAGKKQKKASAPGGEKPQEKMQKVKEDEDADEDVIAEEEVTEGELPPALKKAIAKKKGEKVDEEEDEDEDDEEEMKESKKVVAKEEDDEDEDEDEDEVEEMAHGKKKLKASYKSEDLDIADDMSALAEAISLDEDTQAKAKTIFEAAVLSKVNGAVADINETFAVALEEEVAKIQEDLTEKVDTYLSYVVEQWASDNELAVERGLKSEITEDFIVSLKKVFEEHYIDVPEDKYDVMAEQQSKIEALETKLNEQIEKNVETAKIVNEAKKQIAIENATKDLTDTQKEKFAGLVESVQFDTEEQYKEELGTLIESYFPKVAKTIEEDAVAVEEISESVNLTGEMKDYVSAISRTFKAK